MCLNRLLTRVMKFRNPQNERGKTNAASWFNFPGNSFEYLGSCLWLKWNSCISISTPFSYNIFNCLIPIVMFIVFWNFSVLEFHQVGLGLVCIQVYQHFKVISNSAYMQEHTIYKLYILYEKHYTWPDL